MSIRLAPLEVRETDRPELESWVRSTAVKSGLARRARIVLLAASRFHELGDGMMRLARWRAQRVVNTELLALYWRIGHTILGRQDAEGWGARVINRLSADLRAAYPDMRGLSRSNLFYMRSFAASWPQEPIVQQAVGRLPWGHVTVLLDKLHDQPQRDWYAAAAAENGWSRNVLLNQIMNRLHERTGAAPSNFAAQLPAKELSLYRPCRPRLRCKPEERRPLWSFSWTPGLQES